VEAKTEGRLVADLAEMGITMVAAKHPWNQDPVACLRYLEREGSEIMRLQKRTAS